MTTRWKMVLFACALLTLLYAVPSFPQSSDDDGATLKEEIEALKEGQAAIQKQLQDIQNLLRAMTGAPSPPANVVININGFPFKGDTKAKVTVVEFSDYQCPFCGRFFRETLPALDRDYIQTGRVKYVFRDYPIEAIHPQAFKAAEAAHCAGEQGKYWPMHDRLFADQTKLTIPELSQHAQALGLDGSRFEQCLQSGKFTAQVRQSLRDGEQIGVSATPTFLLGFTDPIGSQITATGVLQGALPYSHFRQALESLLASPR